MGKYLRLRDRLLATGEFAADEFIVPAAASDAVFTFSIHAARNFPFRKEASDLDIELADGTGDDEYLCGLARRDEMVLGTLKARRIPVAIAMAGGYARDIEDSVAIHATTVSLAARIFAS